ncbi:MAG: hypothetical protein ACRD3E_16560 [Terriglobales bacterium]
MDQNKRKKLAVLVMVLGLIGFFVSFAHFGLSNTKIEYANPAYMLKLLCGCGFIVLGLFAGMYLYAGKTFAARFATSLGGALLIAYLIGLAMHR